MALITGGGSGIGRGLAVALHQRGVPVVVAGRREEPLKALCDAHPGMRRVVLDVTRGEDIARVRSELVAQFPQLDCVVNNAGMQRMVNFAKQEVPLDFANAELDANLRGLMMMCAAFVPHLRQVTGGTLINISSGLAFAPRVEMPVYCATKAAVRSFTLSLRRQLKGTGVRVIELAPPAVQTDLHDHMGPHGKQIGMPLVDFVVEAMAGLDRGDDEFGVGHAAGGLKAAQGAFGALFESMNS
jgi:uncharacterized oxidoreductase